MDFTITPSPTLFDGSKSAPSLSTSSAGSAPSHLPSSARRISHPRVVQRRRCRSECLAPVVPSVDMKLGENLPELRHKSPHSVFRNNTSHQGQQRGSTAHGRKLFSILDTRKLNGGVPIEENTKENIATGDLFGETDCCGEDTDELTSLRTVCIRDFDLYTDKALVKNQQYLYELNEEIDKKYFDVLSAARNDSKGSAVAVQKSDEDAMKDFQHEHKRRARARSESEPHDLYRPTPLMPMLAKCSGNDVSSQKQTMYPPQDTESNSSFTRNANETCTHNVCLFFFRFSYCTFQNRTALKSIYKCHNHCSHL